MKFGKAWKHSRMSNQRNEMFFYHDVIEKSSFYINLNSAQFYKLKQTKIERKNKHKTICVYEQHVGRRNPYQW